MEVLNFEYLLVCLAGVFAGTLTGAIPGIGVTIAMVIMTPVLLQLDVMQMLLFYMALSATVQFTGTVPSVFFGMPGETNSLPASIEGPKFARKNQSMLAIGLCGLGSLVGSLVGVVLTVLLVSLIVPYVEMFFSGTLKFYLYCIVVVFLLFVFNKGKLLVNIGLCAIGFVLTLPGESPIQPDFRYTFGIDDLKFGIPLLPVLIGFIVIPSLTKSIQFTEINTATKTIQTPFVKVLHFARKQWASILRGSVLGYFCGFIPGVSTLLATNSSYSLEKKINPNRPARQLVSAESANNSGQLASLLPLLILGIPITGSEAILYSLMIEAGWDPVRFLNFEETVDLLYNNLSHYYFLINVMALIVAWPFAMKLAKMLSFNYRLFVKTVILLLVIATFYLGYTDYRLIFYIFITVFFSIIGYLLKRYNCVPVVFMFIIGADLQTVAYRMLLTHELL